MKVISLHKWSYWKKYYESQGYRKRLRDTMTKKQHYNNHTITVLWVSIKNKTKNRDHMQLCIPQCQIKTDKNKDAGGKI